jgi:hypothetical protein
MWLIIRGKATLCGAMLDAPGLSSTPSHAGQFINNIAKQVQVLLSNIAPPEYRVSTLRTSLAILALALDSFIFLCLYRPW